MPSLQTDIQQRTDRQAQLEHIDECHIQRTGDDDGVDDGLPLGDVLALCEHEAEQADHQQRGYQEAEQPHQDDVGGDDEDDGDEALDLFLTVQEGLCLSGGLPDGEDQAADQQDACADVYVKCEVEIPKKLNKAQRDALKKFEGTLKEENYEKRKGFFKKLKDMFNA